MLTPIPPESSPLPERPQHPPEEVSNSCRTPVPPLPPILGSNDRYRYGGMLAIFEAFYTLYNNHIRSPSITDTSYRVLGYWAR